MAYNVHWADGRAVVAYPTKTLATKAATILHADRVTYGPAQGHVRRDLPRKK